LDYREYAVFELSEMAMSRSVHRDCADGVAIRWHVFGPRLSLFDGLILGVHPREL
jgi:hypothetical protein